MSSKHSTAQKRWKFLSKAVFKSFHKNILTLIPLKMSRKFVPPFKLFTLQALESTVLLFEYKTKINKEIFSVIVHLPTRVFTLEEISGFNNSGNVCVWPAEHVMAYFVLNNLKAFHEKRVLELGGGMTCLASLMLAKYSTVAKIHMTDGSASAVENVAMIIYLNNMDPDCVSCAVLEWNGRSTSNMDEEYDFILLADCLFFKECQHDLVEVLWKLLSRTGVAIIFAPLRGDSFTRFVALAEYRGFLCSIEENYDERIWNQHSLLRQRKDYDSNKSYPLLLEMFKPWNWK